MTKSFGRKYYKNVIDRGHTRRERRRPPLLPVIRIHSHGGYRRMVRRGRNNRALAVQLGVFISPDAEKSDSSYRIL